MTMSFILITDEREHRRKWKYEIGGCSPPETTWTLVLLGYLGQLLDFRCHGHGPWLGTSPSSALPTMLSWNSKIQRWMLCDSSLMQVAFGNRLMVQRFPERELNLETVPLLPAGFSALPRWQWQSDLAREKESFLVGGNVAGGTCISSSRVRHGAIGRWGQKAIGKHYISGSCSPHCDIDWQTNSNYLYQKTRVGQHTHWWIYICHRGLQLSHRMHVLMCHYRTRSPKAPPGGAPCRSTTAFQTVNQNTKQLICTASPLPEAASKWPVIPKGTACTKSV